MKIALIKETKNPIDNRVALTPKQVAELNDRFPQHQIVVQSSDIRAYTDDEYRAEGVQVINDVNDADILFGIKEAKINSLISNKQYFFFGHIAKMQEYNRPLLQAFIQKGITFYDYEYLTDNQGQRVCAFGWWAGVVGLYYTLQGYGLKYKLYSLPKPDNRFTLAQLIDSLKSVNLPKVKILVTGRGRVSQGVQYVLKNIGAIKMTEEEYFSTKEVNHISYCVAYADHLCKRKDGKPFSSMDFKQNPQEYESDFERWALQTDILISAHFWDPMAPVYLTKELLLRPDLRIRMVGDITCDINGCIKSTVRSSTHDAPFYDYNPSTQKEEPAFSSENNISVMAVDTCPNALAMETSEYFGKMLITHVFDPLLNGKSSDVIHRSMILEKGILTPKFSYLKNFAEEK
jgi:alanine dehydrogenase